MADSNAALSNSLTAAAAGPFNLTSWPGLSDKAALKMAKNYTALFSDADPLAASGEALGAQIEATFGPEVVKNDTKTNAAVDALNQLGSFVTAGKADDQAFLDDLNSRLAKYNIEFTGERERGGGEEGEIVFCFCFKTRTFFRLFLLLLTTTTSLSLSLSLSLFLLLQARTSPRRPGSPTAPRSSPGPSRA